MAITRALVPLAGASGTSATHRSSWRTGVAVSLVLIGLAWGLDRVVGAALDLRPHPAVESFAEWVSVLGEGWVLALVGVVLAVVFAWRKRWRWAQIALAVTIAALLTGATATVLRTIIGRTRPHVQAPQGVYGVWYHGRWIAGRYDFGSFPSGHAATVVGLVAALWAFRRRAGMAAVPYAVMVCWSRVALGNHHLSDVVAASCLGIFGGGFFARRVDLILGTAGRGMGAALGWGTGSGLRFAANSREVAAAIARMTSAGGHTQAPVLSVVVPCFNEEGNLGPLAEAVARAVTPLGIVWELVVIDDCSRDQSWEVLRGLGAADGRIRGLRLARNSGQSAALWAGIKAARGRFIATMDADLQNVPADLPVLLAALEGCDCACGSRVATRKHGDRVIRRLASQVANGVRNWLTRETVTDSGCGYRVFRRECVRHLKFFRGMHRFLPTLIRLEGFTVCEVPITHHPRLSGHSHYGIWDRLLTSTYDLLAVRWMQQRMFPRRIAETLNLSAPMIAGTGDAVAPAVSEVRVSGAVERRTTTRPEPTGAAVSVAALESSLG